MEKVVDFNKSIYDLCKENDEIITIMKDLGFKDIANPMMLNTAGRFMTIQKGSIAKGIPIDKIKEEFINKGYSIID